MQLLGHSQLATSAASVRCKQHVLKEVPGCLPHSVRCQCLCRNTLNTILQLAQVYVRPRSKHCRVCNRCTEDFDHHCMWLNNCVGRANYPYFFTLLCSTLLLVSTHLGVSLYLFAQSFAHRALIQPLQLSRYQGHISMNGLRVVWALTVGTSIILEGLLVDLLSFHLVLRYKGLSTYDYILAQREAQEQQHSDQFSASLHQRLQQQVSCLHLGRKARIAPSEVSLEALGNLPRKPHRKLRVHLNPVSAWRVRSKTPSSPTARARFSSMAEYIMPALFAGKVPEAAKQADPTNASAAPSEPNSADHISAMQNPVFDIEAQTAAPRQVSSSRLPVLLGPTAAWGPVDINSSATGPPDGSAFVASQAAVGPLQHQQSTDNVLFVQPLLAGT